MDDVDKEIEAIETGNVYDMASARTVEAALRHHRSILRDATVRFNDGTWDFPETILASFGWHVMSNPACPSCREDLAWASERTMPV
jgi:hypothetical protein